MRNKVVLITGCSSGFGRCMVSLFLEAEWTVVATMRKASERESLLESDIKKYPKALFVRSLDVTKEDECSDVLRFIQNELGKLDCVVNNAGYGLFGALEETVMEQVQRQVDVNFVGGVRVIKHCLPLLRESKGSIINISSLFGFMPFPMTSIYCASKFAIEGLSESLYHELKPHGVQVAVVQPAAYKTNFGKNCEWALNSSDTASPYSRQYVNYCNFKESLAKKNRRAPEIVARKVLKLANKKSLPFRNSVDLNTSMTYFLRKWVPDVLCEKLFGRVFTKIFAKAS